MGGVRALPSAFLHCLAGVETSPMAALLRGQAFASDQHS
jgi:predicted protein tyrosine phosphatase